MMSRPARSQPPARRKPSSAKRPSAPPRRSGRGDATDSEPSASAAGERLQKILAAAGIASRRESEQVILEGRVEVDGQVVVEMGTRVDPRKQEIRVDGEPLPRPKLQYFAVHKPAGVVCTARDPAGRPRVIDLLPKDVGRVFNVGRLDLASEGLILVTNDGELANRLTHPRHGVCKEYEVQVAGHADPEVLAQLKKGVHLSEGLARAVHVRIKAKRKNSTLLTMVLDEGRNREIRRLLARIGHKVQRLTRVSVGPLRLGELPRGAVRPLTPIEVKKLREAASNPGKYATGQGEERTPQQRRISGARKRAAAAGKAAAHSGSKSDMGSSKNRPGRKQRGRR